ncbi:MAG TPA: hypothetical protein PLQ32_01395 [Flavihumibacter sp.]|nr:hypothetical protein [Flavihumibacter sp.]HQD08733.1 hypothetical protein [Flavihumibacter sp.]
MHKILLFVCLLGIKWGLAQSWQQDLHYRIDVQLQADTKTADCMWQLDYSNNSPDTLHSIWMSISPNAWKNDRTAYSEQLLQLRQTDFYFSNETEKGYISRLSFRMNGKLVTTKAHATWPDVVELVLTEPIAPGASVHLESPYHVKLPKLIDRFGYADNVLCFADWYPRPLVYDENGWHIMPTLRQGPLYQDAASFEVNIQTGNGWQIASAARPAQSTESNYYQFNAARQIEFTWMAFPRSVTKPATAGDATRKNGIQLYDIGVGTKTTGVTELAEKVLENRRLELGDYPYASAQIITGWPTQPVYIPGWILIPKQGRQTDLARVIDRQVLEQYLYSININHREKPWLVKGLVNYLQSPDQLTATDTRKLQYINSRRWQQPFLTPADSLPLYNLEAMTSVKGGMHFREAAKAQGIRAYDSSLQRALQLYRFQRPPATWMPTPADSSISALHPSSVALNLFPFRRSSPGKYAFGLLPAIGYNHYDGVMGGLLLHNIEAWQPKLEYLVAPLYGFRSKKFSGLTDIRYNLYGKQYRSNWQIGVQAALFSMDELTGNDGREVFRFSKIAPYIRWQLPETDPWSYRQRSIQFKSYFIGENELQYNNSNYFMSTTHRQLQQLVLHWKDDRILYPYDYKLQVDYQPDFTRVAVEGKYFFNYPKPGRGFSLRVFAGKFFYNQSTHSQLGLSRYFLNLTGANGYEDYTYSDYFVGRNEFAGWQSQQIMERDGFFKVRTDLLNSKIGKTDDWLAAVNMRTDIPDGINPLSLLPVRVPLRLFADMGTYGDAWSENYDGQRILFDAGLQVSLLHEAITIFIPVIASKPFRDYNKSILGENRFWKTVSFSINLETLRNKSMQANFGK